MPIFVLIVALFFGGVGHAAQEPYILSTETKYDLQTVQEQMGRTIPESDIPTTYRLLRTAFDRVASSQEALIEHAQVPINYLFVLDSPFVNAFVSREQATGVRVSVHLVFVTTAMINKCIDLDPRRLSGRYPGRTLEAARELEILSGAERLAAILAHELAHPLDQLIVRGRPFETGLSIDKEYGRRGSQALEIRADIDGAGLLRSSDLRESSMLDALERILDGETAANSLEAGDSTHPENSMRLTALRMFLSLNRLRQGENRNTKPLDLTSIPRNDLVRELKEHEVAGGAYPWAPPQTLNQALGRLKRIERVGIDLREIEFNRLIAQIDFFVGEKEKANGQLSKEEKEEFIETIKFVLRNNLGQPIWSQEQRIKLLADLPDSAPVLKMPVHSEALKRLKIYADPVYVKAMVDFNQQNEKPLLELASYINQKKFVEKFGETYVDEVIRHLVNEIYMLETIAKARDGHLVGEILRTMQKKLAVDVTREKLAFLFIESARKDIHLPFFLTSVRSSSDLHAYSKRFSQLVRQTRIRAFAGNKEARRQYQELFEFTRWFWERRGFFGLLELIANAHNSDVMIDWDLIAEILGLDRHLVNNQVGAAVMKTLETGVLPDIGTLISSQTGYSSGVEPQVHQGSPFEDKAEPTMPRWYQDRHGNEIVRQRLEKEKSGDGLELFGSGLLARSVVVRDPKIQRQLYVEHVTDFLAKLKKKKRVMITEQNVADWLKSLEGTFTQRWWFALNKDHIIYHVSSSAIAESIDRSTALTDAEKNVLLRFIFVRGREFDEVSADKVNKEFFRWASERPEDVRQMTQLLMKYKVIQSVSDLFRQLKASPHFKPIQDIRLGLGEKETLAYKLEDYFILIDSLADLLLAEIQSAGRLSLEQIQQFTAVLNSPLGKDVPRAVSNTPAIQSIRDHLAAEIQRAGKKLSLAQKRAFFLDLTQSGPSVGTDSLFKSDIFPTLEQASSKGDMLWLKGVLIKERIQSHDLRLKLAKASLRPRIDEMKGNLAKLRKESLYSLISDLNMMAPQGSLAKDQFIEDIAWELQLKDANLFAFIEDQKTSNWKKENPMLVNAGSVVANGIYKMSALRRQAFLRYLMDPKASKQGLPDEVVRELTQQALDQLIKSEKDNHQKSRRDVLEAKARRIARIIKLEIEGYMRDSAPTERIPLIEVALTAGPGALLKQQGAPLNVIRDFLKYEANGLEEKLLLSYLGVIPEHEVAPSLAYLLSQAATDKGSVASLFEVFGTVGIKFGQLASIWQLFGPEIARETQHLKDRAMPMSRYEIFGRMQELLAPEVYRRIEPETILGSASVKTVVKARLDGQKPIVMALQAEPIANQIRTNIDLGRRFLDELEKRNLVNQSRMLGTLIEALRSQLEEEIDFKLESERFERAKKVMREYSATLGRSAGGWRFDVPGRVPGLPLSSQLAFYDLAQGVPFDKLSPELQREVGPHMVKASLAMLFRYGWFDADRHKGNWLIDTKTKTIYALDFGQLERFESEGFWKDDPRLVLVGFLRAVKSRSAKDIVYYASRMTKSGSTTPMINDSLTKEIEANLKQGIMSDQIIALLTTLTEAGFQFDRRYSFGALKGLLILYGERYVSDEEFLKILSREATAVTLWNLPKVARTMYKRFKDCQDALDPAHFSGAQGPSAKTQK